MMQCSDVHVMLSDIWIGLLAQRNSPVPLKPCNIN